MGAMGANADTLVGNDRASKAAAAPNLDDDEEVVMFRCDKKVGDDEIIFYEEPHSLLLNRSVC